MPEPPITQFHFHPFQNFRVCCEIVTHTIHCMRFQPQKLSLTLSSELIYTLSLMGV